MSKQPPPAQIKSLDCDDDTRSALLELVTRRIQVKSELDRLKAEEKDLNSMIMPLLKLVNVKRVALEDWTCGIKPWGNSQLSKDLLLQSGVTAGVIAACTIKQKGETIEARGPQDKSEEGD